MRIGGLALGLAIVLLLAGLPGLFDPSTLALLRAVQDLGPISGWRCAHSATYVYDPRREQPERALLAEPPENVVKAQATTALVVERVEANLRGGDTVVWTHLAAPGETATGAGVPRESVTASSVQRDSSTSDSANAEAVERRVYVLAPGRVQTIGLDLPEGRIKICNSHLADWQIVVEHTLG